MVCPTQTSCILQIWKNIFLCVITFRWGSWALSLSSDKLMLFILRRAHDHSVELRDRSVVWELHSSQHHFTVFQLSPVCFSLFVLSTVLKYWILSEHVGQCIQKFRRKFEKTFAWWRIKRSQTYFVWTIRWVSGFLNWYR